MSDWKTLEPQIAQAMEAACTAASDPSHDFSHVLRVVALAKQLATQEKACLEIVVPAAYLHDFELIDKSDPRRSQASRLSAQKAAIFLKQLGLNTDLIADIAHAIEAHSFSANITPRTLEAKIVQDADRLDGIGAIGVARCFALSGVMKRKFYNVEDPFCDQRKANDQENSLDHFFVKILKVPELLQTESARIEGQKRLKFMQSFLQQLRSEIT